MKKHKKHTKQSDNHSFLFQTSPGLNPKPYARNGLEWKFVVLCVFLWFLCAFHGFHMFFIIFMCFPMVFMCFSMVFIAFLWFLFVFLWFMCFFIVFMCFLYLFCGFPSFYVFSMVFM